MMKRGFYVVVVLVGILATALFSVPTAKAEDLATVTSWFTDTGACRNIPMEINGTTTPQVSFPNGESCDNGAYSGPSLVFKLVRADATYTSYTGTGCAATSALGPVIGAIGCLVGSGSGDNVAWTIFRAYKTDGTAVDNLYLIGDNKGPNWIIRYADPTEYLDTNNVSGKETMVTLNLLDDKDSPGTTPNNTYQALYRYLYDEPTSKGDCANGIKYQTGPSQPAGQQTITETYGDLSGINADCLDVSPTSWATAWGVTVTNSVGANGQYGANCTLQYIFTHKSGDSSLTSTAEEAATGAAILGPVGAAVAVATGVPTFNEILRNLGYCLINAVFVPAVRWAGAVVDYAAGLSMTPARHETIAGLGIIRPPTTELC